MRLRQSRLIARLLERVAVGLVLVTLGFWLLVVRPLGEKLRTEQQVYRVARQQKLAAESRVARWEKIQVTNADAGLKDFLNEHMPLRRRSFSKAADLVRNLSRDSGVQLASVSYRLSESKGELLQRLGVDVNVQGPFANVLKFAHAVETSPDFLLLRGFALEAGEGGTMALRMATDLYLRP